MHIQSVPKHSGEEVPSSHIHTVALASSVAHSYSTEVRGHISPGSRSEVMQFPKFSRCNITSNQLSIKHIHTHHQF